MAIEKLAPDALLEQINLSGAVTDIDEDPDSPDANWLTHVVSKDDTICRVSFPTPTDPPRLGTDLQEFKVWVRRQPGSGIPQVRIEIYEDGILLATILANTNVNSALGELFSATWNASLLAQTDGRNVECYIYGTAVGGGLGNRCTVEVGAVEWLCQGTIDIGALAIGRASNGNIKNYTMFGMDNPSNGSGTIDTVEVWLESKSDPIDMWAGTFFLVSGTTYECRDSESLGDVAVGSKQTLVGLSIDVETGDHIGCHCKTAGTTVYIEKDTSGFLGNRYKVGEYIDTGDQASYGTEAGDAISLYGTGVAGGGTPAWFDILTRFNLTVRAFKDLATRFRLWIQDYQDTSTRFKLTAQAFQDIVTRFRLTAQAFQDIATRFKLGIQNYKDIATRFNLIAQGYKDIATRFVILAGTTAWNDIATRFKLTIQGYQDAATRFLLSAQGYQDIATRFKLTIRGYQDAVTRFRLNLGYYRDIATRFILQVQGFRDVATRFRLNLGFYQDITARFRLNIQGYQDVATRFRLNIQGYQDVATRFILALPSYKDVAARFSLMLPQFKDVATRFGLSAFIYRDAPTRFILYVPSWFELLLQQEIIDLEAEVRELEYRLRPKAHFRI